MAPQPSRSRVPGVIAMSLFDDFPYEPVPWSPPFDGETYDPAIDGDRLAGQLGRVAVALRTGEWFTIAALRAIAGGTEAAVSARIRDLRKSKFGGHTVERRRVAGEAGLWEYRLVTNGKPLP